MKRYYVVNEDKTLVVRKANFNDILGEDGLWRCNLVRVTPNFTQKRGFVKRDRAEAVARKATEYCGEKFIVISNKD